MKRTLEGGGKGAGRGAMREGLVVSRGGGNALEGRAFECSKAGHHALHPWDLVIAEKEAKRGCDKQETMHGARLGVS